MVIPVSFCCINAACFGRLSLLITVPGPILYIIDRHWCGIVLEATPVYSTIALCLDSPEQAWCAVILLKAVQTTIIRPTGTGMRIIVLSSIQQGGRNRYTKVS